MLWRWMLEPIHHQIEVSPGHLKEDFRRQLEQREIDPERYDFGKTLKDDAAIVREEGQGEEREERPKPKSKPKEPTRPVKIATQKTLKNFLGFNGVVLESKELGMDLKEQAQRWTGVEEVFLTQARKCPKVEEWRLVIDLTDWQQGPTTVTDLVYCKFGDEVWHFEGSSPHSLLRDV
jgi:hypothetical protein